MTDSLERIQLAHDEHMKETMLSEAMGWDSCYPHQGRNPEDCGDCARDVLISAVRRLKAIEVTARNAVRWCDHSGSAVDHNDCHKCRLEVALALHAPGCACADTEEGCPGYRANAALRMTKEPR